MERSEKKENATVSLRKIYKFAEFSRDEIEKMSREEVKEILREEGINVDSLVNKIKNKIASAKGDNVLQVAKGSALDIKEPLPLRKELSRGNGVGIPSTPKEKD